MENQQWTTRVKKNTLKLGIWTGAWTLSMALASFGPKFIWDGNVSLTIMGILISTGFGVGMIIANIKYLNGLDEMQRKIHMDAMGLALGVGVVGGLSYALLDTTNVIAQDAEIAFLVIIISLTYLISMVIGVNRYK